MEIELPDMPMARTGGGGGDGGIEFVVARVKLIVPSDLNSKYPTYQAAPLVRPVCGSKAPIGRTSYRSERVEPEKPVPVLISTLAGQVSCKVLAVASCWLPIKAVRSESLLIGSRTRLAVLSWFAVPIVLEMAAAPAKIEAIWVAVCCWSDLYSRAGAVDFTVRLVRGTVNHSVLAG